MEICSANSLTECLRYVEEEAKEQREGHAMLYLLAGSMATVRSISTEATTSGWGRGDRRWSGGDGWEVNNRGGRRTRGWGRR